MGLDGILCLSRRYAAIFGPPGRSAKWNRDREESHGFGSRPKATGSAPSAAAAGENTHRRVRRSPPPMRSDPGAWDQQRTETPHGDRTHTDGLYWGTGQPELRTIAREAVPAGHRPAGLRQFRVPRGRRLSRCAADDRATPRSRSWRASHRALSCSDWSA